MASILKVSYMRDIEAQFIREEITYNRMLELIEDKVLEHCVLKDDLLTEIEKNIDYVNINKAHVYGQSQMWSGSAVQKAIVYNLEAVKGWALKYKPKAPIHHWERPKSAISPREWKADCENIVNEMRAAQSEPVQMQCSKCFTKWNIETPAIYKETFCPKCGR